MAKKKKCPNCDRELQVTYTKDGVKIYFCPRVPARVVPDVFGMRALEIPCPKPQ